MNDEFKEEFIHTSQSKEEFWKCICLGFMIFSLKLIFGGCASLILLNQCV